MEVYVQTTLPCPAERAWEEVQTSALLLEVGRPLVVLRPSRGGRLPKRWERNQLVDCRPFLFGVVPLSTRTLIFERVDGAAREIQTREWDRLVRRWDHLIAVRDAGAGQTVYSDRV